MKTFLRILSALLTGAAVKYFIFWISFAFSAGRDLRAFAEVAAVVSWLLALAAVLIVWRQTETMTPPRGAGKCALTGGVALGAIGFLGGFFGGFLIWPRSNLAPLLGFITGPAAVVIGSLLGGIFGALQNDEGENNGLRLVPRD